MAIPITVPRLGWSMEEGIFVEWLRRDGDAIAPGDALFALENEKASENIEALDPGILRITSAGPKPGDTVKVGQVLAYLVAEGEAAPAMMAASETKQPAPRAVVRTERDGGERPQPGAAKTISPRARRLARELGINYQELHGSGCSGRIREKDVRAAASAATGGRIIPHTRLRKTIAAHMVAGVTQTAPVTLTTRADATNLVNLRNRFKAEIAAAAVPSYTDLLVKLTAAALRQHPLLQAQWRDEGLFVPDGIHIAIAVDTEAGLLAPVIHDVDRLNLQQIAAGSRELVSLGRAGRLTADQMRGATFTVTNLGMFGVDGFSPIIHLPQCAVLGVGRIVREPAVIGETLVARDRITLSLTFDHRIVDGAPAARFLDALRQSIEQPDPGLLS